MKKYIIFCAVLTAMIAGAGSGQSQLLDKISLHGFGSWAGGMTNNENRYFLWNEDGNLEHVEAALNIRAELYDNVSVYVQTSFDRTWLGTEADLDYAFAEWSFSDLLTFRAGKVNAPFMLYSEVYDVRIIRPFFNLPLGIYHDMGAEAYKGIGLTGTFSPHQGWQVQYDIYGGTMTQYSNRRISHQFIPEGYDEEGNFVASKEGWSLEIPDQSVEKMIGGRLFISPPLEGMRFGLSAYTGEQKYYESDSLTEYEEYWSNEKLFNTMDKPLFFGLSAEYIDDTWELRCEYLRTFQDDPDYLSNKIYAEAAYRFTEHWQVAVRYEYNTVEDFPMQGFLDNFDSLREHKELVFGLNYWFTPRLALKGSFHLVQGNSFTVPADDDDYEDGLDDGSFKEEETQLLLLGVQFSF
ncbi:MAG: hypothetical protein D3915_02895 [Candidatus Electrothrix sp. AU1_5]|nr:hypothetical protein [Candidatus Electrothrix gigas]